MSDTENATASILDVPHGGSFSLRQESISLPPSSVPVEQSSGYTDLASTFALFKDYFDKKLTALKRDIQEDSLSNSDSIAKKLKKIPKYPSNSKETKSSSISIRASRGMFSRLQRLSVKGNLKSFEVTWKN